MTRGAGARLFLHAIALPHMVVYDGYAKTDNVQTMINDQKSKFMFYTSNIKQSFLLSWTMTHDVVAASARAAATSATNASLEAKCR